MIYPKLSDGTIDWCEMCKHKDSDFYDLCCECEYPENSDDPPTLYEPKPMTNGDRIRRMTDEELAEMFERWVVDCGCNNVPCEKVCEERRSKYQEIICRQCWLEWLKETDDGASAE